MASKRKHKRQKEAGPERAPKRSKKSKKSKSRSSSRSATDPHEPRRRVSAAAGVVKKKKSSRRTAAAAPAPGGSRSARAIPVEGLAGGSLSGRYPGPAKPIEQFVTKSWRPKANQDLNKADTIHFSMTVRKGQIIR